MTLPWFYACGYTKDFCPPSFVSPLTQRRAALWILFNISSTLLSLRLLNAGPHFGYCSTFLPHFCLSAYSTQGRTLDIVQHFFHTFVSPLTQRRAALWILFNISSTLLSLRLLNAGPHFGYCSTFLPHFCLSAYSTQGRTLDIVQHYFHTLVYHSIHLFVHSSFSTLRNFC